MIFTCTDACCAINLINGQVLDVIARIPDRRLCVQGLVEDEMGEEFSEITRLVSQNRWDLVPGDKILASEVGAIAERYKIGLGESECIVIGKKFECTVASDDRKARGAATAELGQSRVTGSLGLLKASVEYGLISPDRAYVSYQMMVNEGAFLPRVERRFFE